MEFLKQYTLSLSYTLLQQVCAIVLSHVLRLLFFCCCFPIVGGIAFAVIVAVVVTFVGVVAFVGVVIIDVVVVFAVFVVFIGGGVVIIFI